MQHGSGSTCFACAEDVALTGSLQPSACPSGLRKTRLRVLNESFSEACPVEDGNVGGRDSPALLNEAVFNPDFNGVVDQGVVFLL